MTYFYDLKAANGSETLEFSLLANKVVLIVNVASLCGFTPQYAELQQLYDTFSHDEFEIIGFPCSQFGDQELQDLGDIRRHVKTTFGVTFPVVSKVKVNGKHTDAVYLYLKEKKKGFLGFKGVKWNFEKFLIDANGEVMGRYLTTVTPISMKPLIEELLRRRRLSLELQKNN